jgi:hypothetical protein
MQLLAMAGTPATSTMYGRVPMWMLDKDVLETVGVLVQVPEGWTQLSIAADVVVRGGTDSGSAVLRAQRNQFGPGGELNALPVTTETAVTTASLAFGILASVTVAPAVTVTPGNRLGISLSRVATDAADTLTGDLGVIGLVLTKLA